MIDWWFEACDARSLATAPELLRDAAEHPRYLGLLATTLTVRYQRGGNPDDLDEAITTARRALDAMPLDDPDRSWVATTLAVALASRHERSGDLGELGEALVLARGTAGHPPVSAARGALLAWAAHTYSNEDTSPRDLRGRDYALRDLRDADLGGADLTGAKLTNADLTGANLAGAILTGACLDHANLTNTVLAGADLTDATLVEAHLTGAHLTAATLDRAVLAEATVDDDALSRAMSRRAAVSPDAERKHLACRHPEARATVIAATGELVATGHEDASIRLWHADTGTLLREHRSGRNWSPDTGFGSSQEDEEEELEELDDPWGEVVALAFSPDGGRLAVVKHGTFVDYDEEYDIGLELWNLDDGSAHTLLDETTDDLDGLHEQRSRPVTLVFSPDSRSLALGTHLPAGIGEHNVCVWDGNAPWLAAPDPDEWHHAVAYSQDSRLVAAGCVDTDFGEYAVTVSHDGAQVERWCTGSEAVLAVSFAADDQVRAVTSGRQRWSAWEWHPDTSDEEPWHHDGALTAAAYSPDGRQLAVATSDRVTLWDAAIGTELWSFAADDVTVLRFAQDGRWLSAGTEQAVHVHDASTGAALPGTARTVAFVPDGYWAIHSDGSVHLHDETGTVIRDLT